MLQHLTHELSILARSVEHKNLSAAAVHVGLSQPQLSRLIAKIEEELNIILLDRSSRRKSGWTEVAVALAGAFQKGMGRLETEILAIAQERELHDLRVGSLEGLSAIAAQFVKKSFDDLKMKTVYLDVLDFKDLDSQFLNGNLDLIFTVRPPNKQKFSHMIEVGYQQLEEVKSSNKTFVCSPSELFNQKDAEKNFQQLLISNSLSFRQHWLNQFGGTGRLPVGTRKGSGKGYYSVYLIGSELINAKLWSKIKDLATE